MPLLRRLSLMGTGQVAFDQSSRIDQYRSSPVDPTSQVQRAYQSSPADQPVKSSTDSISSLNLSSSSQVTPAGEMAAATQKGGSTPHGKQFHKGRRHACGAQSGCGCKESLRQGERGGLQIRQGHHRIPSFGRNCWMTVTPTIRSRLGWRWRPSTSRAAILRRG